jgi:hypothetical protein
MKLFKYEVFNSNKDFCEWQQRFELVEIVQISPINVQVDTTNNKENEIKFSSTVGVFIVYREREK